MALRVEPPAWTRHTADTADCSIGNDTCIRGRCASQEHRCEVPLARPYDSRSLESICTCDNASALICFERLVLLRTRLFSAVSSNTHAEHCPPDGSFLSNVSPIEKKRSASRENTASVRLATFATISTPLVQLLYNFKRRSNGKAKNTGSFTQLPMSVIHFRCIASGH